MNQEQLNAIKDRMSKATPGPWLVGESRYEGRFNAASANENYDLPACLMGIEDAEFVTHSREDVPALVAEVERLQNRCELYELVKRNDKKTIEQIYEFNERLTTDLFERMDYNGKLAKQNSDAVKEIERLRKALEKVMEVELPIMEGWETLAYKVARQALDGDSNVQRKQDHHT
ncbi:MULTISPECIES: hypothetical protein [unclassified Lysinibacillus]|nr:MULTISPECIES: hypothetical protein [unclassified Lysinibacillus]